MRFTWTNQSERRILVSNFSMTRNSLLELYTLDRFPYVWALLIICIDAPESTTKSLFSGKGLMAQAGTYFPKVRRMLLYFSPLILEHFWPASTLLHGHLALAIQSLLEIDPQILERWGCAGEAHLGKSIRAKDFGLECQRDVQRLLWILHIGSVSVCLSSSVKSMKTSAPYPGIRNPIVVYLMSRHSQQVFLFYNNAHSAST